MEKFVGVVRVASRRAISWFCSVCRSTAVSTPLSTMSLLSCLTDSVKKRKVTPTLVNSVRHDVISFTPKHLLLRVLLSPFGRRRRVWIVSRRIVCGRLTPCSLKYSPQALHTISPRMFRRQMVVVVVPQFVQDMSFCCEFCCCCCCCCGDCCWDGAVDLVVSSSCGLLLPDALLFVSDRAAAPPWGGVLAEDECSATRNSTFPVVALLPVASLIVAPPPTTPTLMPLLSSDAVGELPSTGVRLGQDCFRRPPWAV